MDRDRKPLRGDRDRPRARSHPADGEVLAKLDPIRPAQARRQGRGDPLDADLDDELHHRDVPGSDLAQFLLGLGDERLEFVVGEQERREWLDLAFDRA